MAGNPNHVPAGAPDGSGGQFTSGPEAGGEKVEESKKKKKSTKKHTAKTSVRKRTKLVEKEGMGGLDALFAKLQDINQGIEIGPLNSLEEVDANIEKFFSKQVISHIDRLYGMTTDGYCSMDQFHPKSNSRVNLNLFTCVFGKYRYPDNHAHLISQEEYDKLASDTKRFVKVYRGFTSSGEKRANIIKSYCTADINNIDLYGNGVYGTNIYTSTSYSYSYHNYTGYPPDASKVLHCLVDNEARSIDSSRLERMASNSLGSYYDYNLQKSVDMPLTASIKEKVRKHLIGNGIEENRAQQIADSFVRQMKSDISLIAILLGYDYQYSSSDQQRNILNLKKWYIRN